MTFTADLDDPPPGAVTLAGYQHAAEFPDDLRRISAQIRDTRNRLRAGHHRAGPGAGPPGRPQFLALPGRR